MCEENQVTQVGKWYTYKGRENVLVQKTSDEHLFNGRGFWHLPGEPEVVSFDTGWAIAEDDAWVEVPEEEAKVKFEELKKLAGI